jgi:hypothetical protein
MKIRKVAYTLAIILLCYDSISTIMASAFYDEFAELNPLYNFLGDRNPQYLYLVVALVLVIVILSFLTALSWTDRPELSRRGFVILGDFFAVYLLAIGLLAIPHNTLVLIGSPGIILSTNMLQRLRAASVVIAGIIVVILDRRRFSG